MTPPPDTETAPVHSAPPLGGGGCPSCDHYESESHVFCHEHGSDSKLRIDRRFAGLCEWYAKTCEGKIVKCSFCGYSYCEYHMELHLR